MSNSNSELKKRILFTIFILLVYRFGTFVPIPGINIEVLKKFFASSGANMFGMINLFSGGALERMSIFALNIMPYITSSIIMQLLTSMYKGLGELKKEGEYGRAKINQYTRYLTIILAFFQSMGVYYALSSGENNAFISDSRIFMLTTCVSLVGGTVMLMWFGERITTSGIGNGISMIIFVGIVSSLPSTIVQIFDLSKTGVYSWITVLLFFAVFAGFLMLVCFIEKTHKRIKIQYPNAAMMKASGMSDSSFLLLKIMGLANDVYAQVGLIMLVGLLGKNAVLIVEFARQKQSQGMPVLEAAIEGAKMRFRPILMTSFAFIAGLIPMAFASGAGSAANNTIGASALGGMLLGTIFGVLVVPGLYYIFASLAQGKKLIKDEHENPLTESIK